MAAVWTLEKHRVLIESDWNLKVIDSLKQLTRYSVLIESDWNLKRHNDDKLIHGRNVLIESDWNLKYVMYRQQDIIRYSINRIRLEFKDNC